MYLDTIRLTNFRNLAGTFELSQPVAVLVGPNNAGKSNLIDALRLTLEPQANYRDRLPLERDDFRHDGDGNPVADELEIELAFGGLSHRQQGRLLTMLDADSGPDRALLRVRALLPEHGRPRPVFYGGRSRVSEVEDWARQAVTFTYLPALRDAQNDLRPGRGTNRLVQLLSAFAPTAADQAEIVDLARRANEEMGKATVVRNARDRVQERLEEIVGAGFAQQVDLMFAEPQFQRVVGVLRALVGDGEPLEMSQNGLGYNNLLYIATLLAGLAQEPEGELHVVLVEEPEAHLHPQLQDLLMRFLEREARASNGRVQVIFTTHSPNLTSAARVARITSMIRRRTGTAMEVTGRATARFGLTRDEHDHLERFLDVTKSSLFFSRAVLLVEGLAEQLLMPLLAEAIDESLVESHVSVVNIGGLAFKPFVHLFGEERLPRRCAIVSDSDPPRRRADGADRDRRDDREAPAEDAPEQDGDVAGQDGDAPEGEEEADPVLSATARQLLEEERHNKHIMVRLARQTFEWDLIAAGNVEWALMALRPLHPRTARRIREDPFYRSNEDYATAILDSIRNEKGRFAQALWHYAEEAEDAGHPITVPDYIAEALRFVCHKPKPSRRPKDRDGAPENSEPESNVPEGAAQSEVAAEPA